MLRDDPARRPRGRRRRRARSLVGGHSIDDAEPKYGLAVTGVVDPRALVTNAGGRAGDVLVLTKPLGVGAIVTGAQARRGGRRRCSPRRSRSMTTLNDAAVRGARRRGRARDDRRHRLRPARPPAQPRARERPRRRGRGRRRAGDRRRRGRCWPTTAPSPAAAGATREYAAEFTTFADGVAPWRRRLRRRRDDVGRPARRRRRRTRPRGSPGAVVGRLVEGEPGAIARARSPARYRGRLGAARGRCPDGSSNPGAGAARRLEGSTPSPLRRRSPGVTRCG